LWYLRIMEDQGVLLAEGEEHRLRHELSIGRGEENDIVLTEPAVSRRHARLVWLESRWLVEDRGSANGTFVNDARVPFGSPHPLRHGDRIGVGGATLLFSWPVQRDDPDRTNEFDAIEPRTIELTPFQLQLVRALCGAWIGARSLDRMPTNEEIAAYLGTPDAVGSVKAGLRRTYAKAGLSELPPHAKRRALCRLGRAYGWF